MARKNKKFSAKIGTPRAKNSGYSEGGASHNNKSLKGYNPLENWVIRLILVQICQLCVIDLQI